MKIQFDDKSYIEVRRSDNPGKVVITISARDHTDAMKKITNAVEITTAEFKQLISDVQIQ
jgi:hypothetical protein